MHRNTNAVVFVEAARGGVREWSSLEYLSGFCDSVGISKWEVHRKANVPIKDCPAITGGENQTI